MIVLSEVPKKYPKLVKAFEKETGRHFIYNNKVTGIFEAWLNQKIKYKNGFFCDDSDCPDYGKEFPSKRSLTSHNIWCNRKPRPLKMDDDISKFFVKFLFEHSYFSSFILFGICKDTVKPHKDEYKSTKRKLFSLTRYHLILGVIEKYNTRTYKINKEVLIELYGNGDDIGKST